MDKSQTPLLVTPDTDTWKLDFYVKPSLLPPEGDVIAIKDETVNLLYGISGGIEDYSMVQPLETFLPADTATLTRENLKLEKSWSGQSMSSDNSASSCATFSTAASQSSGTTSWMKYDPYVNHDYIFGTNNSEDPASTLSSENAKQVTKPYFHVCAVCSKVFRRRGFLQRHERIHSNGRTSNYIVDSKAFARRTDQNRHEGSHFKKKKFTYDSITDYNTLSESSRSNFSSASSDKANITGFNGAPRDNVSSNITVLPDSNLERPEGHVDVSNADLSHSTYVDTASIREYNQDQIGAEPVELEWPILRPSWIIQDCAPPEYAYNLEHFAEWPSVLSGQDDEKWLLGGSESLEFPLNGTKVEEPFGKTHTVEVPGAKDFEVIGNIEGAETDVTLSYNDSHKHDKSAQLASARRSLSKIGSIFGKASPYSVQSQGSESDSCFEEEIEMDFDEYGYISSPSPSLSRISGLGARTQILFTEILRAFWDVYNKEFPLIISRCIMLTGQDFTNGATSGAPKNTSSRSASTTPRTSSTATSSSISSLSGRERKISEHDRPSKDDDQGPTKPLRGPMLMSGEQSITRFACPYRKHNRRKYNMYHYQRCALGSFGSIARVKEHLYRRHIAPIQCVRCWLFFKDQENLNIHISAINICARRDGEVAEGITPSIEKKLRSRKKPPGSQTDHDRWRDIYRMLFPEVADDEIPSPSYETVQDDTALSFVPLDVSIEEFMRQAVPRLFTSRLETEFDNMSSEDSGLLNDPAALRETLISRMTTFINEAQDSAVAEYRQITSENNLQLNQLITPGASSTSESFMNLSQETSYAASYPREDDLSTRQQLAAPSMSWDLQSINQVAANDALQNYLSSQVSQEAGNTDLDSRIDLNSHSIKGDTSHSSRLGRTKGECSTISQTVQKEHESNGYSLNLNLTASDDWNDVEASWLNNDYT